MFQFTTPQDFAVQLKTIDRAAKSRATKLKNGSISSTAFYNGILKDLDTNAKRGRVHAYAIILAMYEETIKEVEGNEAWNRLVYRAEIARRQYLAAGSMTPPIPF